MDPAPPVPVELSVVVPFFNEEGAVGELVGELRAALGTLHLSWECVFVDDGSTDRTVAELEQAIGGDPCCRVLRLGANRGQGAALFAGFQASRGRLLGMMDGDGQNVPADIARLLPLLGHADLAVGVRAGRHDSIFRRGCSRVANAVRRRLLRDGVSDAGCALKVFRREVAASFMPVTMLNPFIPAFAAAGGFRIAETAIQHRPRTSGKSKYGASVILWRPMCDMLALWWMLRRRIPVERLPPPGGTGL